MTCRESYRPVLTGFDVCRDAASVMMGNSILCLIMNHDILECCSNIANRFDSRDEISLPVIYRHSFHPESPLTSIPFQSFGNRDNRAFCNPADYHILVSFYLIIRFEDKICKHFSSGSKKRFRIEIIVFFQSLRLPGYLSAVPGKCSMQQPCLHDQLRSWDRMKN